jgi:DNA-binding GntR family transcriptional regulator
MERSGNRTLAVQGGVLQDIVTTHMNLTVTRGIHLPDSSSSFRKTIRSYTKLIQRVEARDGPGAEEHWRAHMEVTAKTHLRDDLKTRPVVDLFT